MIGNNGSSSLAVLLTKHWVAGQDSETLETLADEVEHSQAKRKNNMKYLQLVIKQSLPNILIFSWLIFDVKDVWYWTICATLLVTYALAFLTQIYLVLRYAAVDRGRLEDYTLHGTSLKATIIIRHAIETGLTSTIGVIINPVKASLIIVSSLIHLFLICVFALLII